MGGPGSGKRSERPSTAVAWSFDVRPAASYARRREAEYGGGSSWAWAHAHRPGHPDLRAWLGFDFEAGEVSIGYDPPDRPPRPKYAWHADEGTTYETLQLAEQPANYGGTRLLARCPGCDRAVGVLWLRPGRRFECRACADLAFETTRLRGCKRAMAVASKLRRQLGDTRQVGLLNLAWADAPARQRGRWRRKHGERCLRLLIAEGKAARLFVAEFEGALARRGMAGALDGD